MWRTVTIPYFDHLDVVPRRCYDYLVSKTSIYPDPTFSRRPEYDGPGGLYAFRS
jgi:hypothetical protein